MRYERVIKSDQRLLIARRTRNFDELITTYL